MDENQWIPKKGEWVVCGSILFKVGMRIRVRENGEIVDIALRDGDDVDHSTEFKLSECIPADKKALLTLGSFTVSFEGKTFEVTTREGGLDLNFGGIDHEIRFLTKDELAIKGAIDLARMFGGQMASEDVAA